MQSSVPELTDLSKEPKRRSSFTAPTRASRARSRQLPAGAAAGRARRALHPALPSRLGSARRICRSNIAETVPDTDQPSAALIQDLKQRGMLDDTLVVWGGEFGRTVYSSRQADRRPITAAIIIRAASPSGWPAAASSPGITIGETDDFSYNIARDPVHVHDLHATILHCLGIDHTRLTYKFQGRHFRLTDVDGNIVKRILAN